MYARVQPPARPSSGGKVRAERMKTKILATLFAAVFIAMLGIGVIIPVLPQLAVQLGAGGFALGVITAAFSLSRGLLQPLVGDCSDYRGRKPFIACGLGIYVMVGLCVPLAQSVAQLVVIRLVQGMGAAMIVPVAMAYISDLSPPGQEGRYMGMMNASLFCGIGFGPVIGGMIADRLDFASVFYAMALLALGALIVVLLLLPPSQPTTRSAPVGTIANMGRMLRRTRCRGILLARFATVLMIVPAMAYLPLIMLPWPGIHAVHVGAVIACRTLVNAVLQLPFGRLADRVDKKILLLVGTVATTLGVYLIPTVRSFEGMLLVYLFLGCSEAILWPVLGAYATEEGRERFGHGAMMGVFNLAMSAGVFIGALFAGAGFDHWGLATAFHLIAVTNLCLTLLATLYIYRGEQQDRAAARPRQEGQAHLG